MHTLKNKVAIVTGAARGIGRAIAERFGRDGARVVLSDISESHLREAAQEVRSAGGEAHTVVADVSRSGDVGRMTDEATRIFGTIDILVNNAGILQDATLLKMTEEQFDKVIAVHLKGTFLCTQAAARIMSQKKYGKIVNISSIASRGNFGQTNYSAAKAGIIGMTKTWALELSKYGINVNAVAPGMIDTDMTASIPAEIRQQMIQRIPLGRTGQPTEVADLIHFLATDEASYVQGEVIGLNGGYQM